VEKVANEHSACEFWLPRADNKHAMAGKDANLASPFMLADDADS